MARSSTRLALAALAAAALLAPALPASAGANIIVLGVDGPGEGVNDPTPVAPVGGNPGVTLGQQRQIVYQFAADIWGAALQSDVDVFVAAAFNPLACTATSAVLGSAGTTFVIRDFPPGPPAVRPLTWYHSALADSIAGFDLVPGFFDISSQFNDRIDTDPTCLGGVGWYYGLDNNAPPGGIDFLNVVLHELTHGLGFANFVNEANGTELAGLDDIYSVFTFDLDQGTDWTVMTNAQRAASAINDQRVVWTGDAVTARAGEFLDRAPFVRALAPPFDKFFGQPAAFGPQLSLLGVLRQLVVADDGVGVTSDGCEPIGNVHNKIALIDRGTCTFVAKVANAQAGGARGVVIANNVAGNGLPGMGGVDPTIAIPSIGVTQAAGDALEAQAPVFARLARDFLQLTGADADDHVRLYAPPVVALGSSISHWDVNATPNLIMEPFINADLEGATTQDLGPWQLADVGWALMDGDSDGVADIEDDCAGSDLSPTVVIDGCDSGVGNAVRASGCSISDEIAQCAAEAANHIQFVACVTLLTFELHLEGVIDHGEKLDILECAVHADIP